MKPMESPYSLQEILLVLWRQKWLVLIITVLGIGVGYGVFEQTKPKYEATTEILIETDKSDNLLYTQNMMETYREILTSSALIKKVNDATGFELSTNDYNETVKISMVNTSQLITITAKSTDSKEPVKLVNGIAEVFKKEITKYSKINTALVLNSASESTSNQESSFNRLISVLIGGVIGLLIAIAYCLIREIYSTKVDSEVKVQRLQTQLLANISKQDTTKHWMYHLAVLISNEKNAGRKTVLLLNDTKQQDKYLQQLSGFLASHQKVAILKQSGNLEGNTHFAKTTDDEADAFIYSSSTPIATLQQKYLELEQQYDVVIVETTQLDSMQTMLLASNRTMFVYLANAKKTSVKQAQSILKKVSQLKMHILGIVIVK